MLNGGGSAAAWRSYLFGVSQCRVAQKQCVIMQSKLNGWRRKWAASMVWRGINLDSVAWLFFSVAVAEGCLLAFLLLQAHTSLCLQAYLLLMHPSLREAMMIISVEACEKRYNQYLLREMAHTCAHCCRLSAAGR